MMKPNAIFTAWQLNIDEQHILWALLVSKVINRQVLQELSLILEELERGDHNIVGMVIGSVHPHHFSYGADLKEVQQNSEPAEIQPLIREGQEIFERLAQLNLPTVAQISGACLGGGLELALACRYRIAEEHSKTRLGLPEIKLGIHPGWGGTVRLPTLVGPFQAFQMMLTGQSLSGRQALKMGLVDEVVPERHLKTAIIQTMLQPKSRTEKLRPWIRLSQLNLFRPYWKKFFIYQLKRKKVNGEHYPAPYALLNQWADLYAPENRTEGLRAECESVVELSQKPTTKNLMRVFSLQEMLKRQEEFSEHHSIKHVHVVGAGVMGGDIAALFALKGYRVTLEDSTHQAIAATLESTYKVWSRKLKNPREVRAALDRLIPDPYGYGRKKADLMIEAIVENSGIKQELWKTLEAQAKPEALLATNTSSIPLSTIASVMKQPERLFGFHFFNPVALMPLIEIVRWEKNSDHQIQLACSIARHVDKLPLVVRSCPGFLINRILMPYMIEAMQLLEEGHAPELIDCAAVQYGMPMGPIELADTVGLDVCHSVAQVLAPLQHIDVPKQLIKRVEQKQLGKKTKRGFYHYKKGKISKSPVKNKDPKLLEILQQRLILRLQNECVACLREQIVESADLLDAGIIFGTGFAPFRGGPLQAARTIGIDQTVALLQHYASTLGDRFKPDPYWDTLKNAVTVETNPHD